MERLLSQFMFVRNKHALFAVVLFSYAFINTGCTKSPGGSVEELIKTAPPMFNGSLAATFLSPTSIYNLTGSCDPISYAIEYSLDNQGTWQTLAGGCPSSTFSISVLFSGRKKVFVRAKTKTGYTATAIATIKILLPPTSSSLNFVAGSVSDNEDGQGTQSSTEHTFTSLSDTTGTVKLQTNVMETAYGP